jgi:tetratricopeptide (TPR) repeat protein
MDCRKSLFLALTLFAGSGGCASLLPTRVAVSDDKAHKPATYVAFADYRASASCTQGINPAEQQQFREEAKLSYLKAIEVDPNHLPAYLGLARLQQTCEDHGAAAATYERALRLRPQDSSLWFEHGICQCRAKNWNAAIQSLRKACELDPANRQYATTLGFTLARAGMYNDSFAVLARQFGEARAHSDLARMLHHLNQPELARQQAMMALSKDPLEQAARTLLASLDQTRAARSPGRAGHKDEIQIVSYTDPANQQQLQPAAWNTTGSTDGAARQIRVPPLPVISIHTKSE